MRAGQELGSPAGVVFFVVVGQTNGAIDQIFHFGDARGRRHNLNMKCVCINNKVIRNLLNSAL